MEMQFDSSDSFKSGELNNVLDFFLHGIQQRKTNYASPGMYMVIYELCEINFLSS